MSYQFKIKGDKYTKQELTDNLLYWYFVDPDNGKDWYKEAKDICAGFAEKYSLPVINVAGILSALSPLKSWKQNVKDTEAFLSGSSYKHTRQQIKKAKDIEASEDQDQIFSILHGKKTANFFLNIIGNCQVVTIDRHIISASTGFEYGTITDRQYLYMTNIIRDCAKEVNVSPAEFQAVVWSNYRAANVADHHKIEVECPF